jgi:hypothetical protein
LKAFQWYQEPNCECDKQKQKNQNKLPSLEDRFLQVGMVAGETIYALRDVVSMGGELNVVGRRASNEAPS